MVLTPTSFGAPAKCRKCGHARAEHRGPDGECRCNYAPTAERPTPQQREQCLCKSFSG